MDRQSRTPIGPRPLLAGKPREAPSFPSVQRCDHEFAPVMLDQQGRHTAVGSPVGMRVVGAETDFQCRKCGQWLSLSA